MVRILARWRAQFASSRILARGKGWGLGEIGEELFFVGRHLLELKVRNNHYGNFRKDGFVVRLLHGFPC